MQLREFCLGQQNIQQPKQTQPQPPQHTKNATSWPSPVAPVPRRLGAPAAPGGNLHFFTGSIDEEPPEPVFNFPPRQPDVERMGGWHASRHNSVQTSAQPYAQRSPVAPSTPSPIPAPNPNPTPPRVQPARQPTRQPTAGLYAQHMQSVAAPTGGPQAPLPPSPPPLGNWPHNSNVRGKRKAPPAPVNPFGSGAERVDGSPTS